MFEKKKKWKRNGKTRAHFGLVSTQWFYCCPLPCRSNLSMNIWTMEKFASCVYFTPYHRYAYWVCKFSNDKVANEKFNSIQFNSVVNVLTCIGFRSEHCTHCSKGLLMPHWVAMPATMSTIFSHETVWNFQWTIVHLAHSILWVCSEWWIPSIFEVEQCHTAWYITFHAFQVVGHLTYIFNLALNSAVESFRLLHWISMFSFDFWIFMRLKISNLR